MENIEELKKQVVQKFTFMEKQGEIKPYSSIRKILRNNQNEKLLLLIVGVQGAGKTTFCQRNFVDKKVINFDDILDKYVLNEKREKIFSGEAVLDQGGGKKSFEEMNYKVNKIAILKIKEELKSGLAIVDAATIGMAFRTVLLDAVKEEYTKVALIVLNPSFSTIRQHLKNRTETYLFSTFEEMAKEEYDFLQLQINEHLLEMGVDYVYFV